MDRPDSCDSRIEDRVMTEIHGTCDPAFNPVREAFAGTFAAEGPTRMQAHRFASTCGDRCVVDLHAGEATPQQAWTADTLVNIWSATKGVVGNCSRDAGR